MRAGCNEAREQRIFIIATQAAVFEGLHMSASTHHQGCTRGDIPFVLGGQSESGVRQSGGNASQFVSHRSHWLNLEWRFFEGFPFSAFHLASACEYQGAIQFRALTRMRCRAIVGDASLK